MKYRVLQPFVSPLQGAYHKVGDVIDFRDYWSSGFVGGLLNHGFIEKLKDESWKPEDGDNYWFVFSDGDIGYNIWRGNDMVHQSRLDMGNCFQSEEEAEKARGWLKAFKVLRDDTKGFKPDWKSEEQGKWEIYYDAGAGEFCVHLQATVNDSLIYFATEEDAAESIKNHEKEWLVYLNVEEA